MLNNFTQQSQGGQARIGGGAELWQWLSKLASCGSSWRLIMNSDVVPPQNCISVAYQLRVPCVLACLVSARRLGKINIGSDSFTELVVTTERGCRSSWRKFKYEGMWKVPITNRCGSCVMSFGHRERVN